MMMDYPSSNQETLESILVSSGSGSAKASMDSQQIEKKPRPADQQALKCPRCDSTNTKFCYYNNYSLSQPRYFCKSCRRYWTKGGTLRNVPVGGGCRKNKRVSSSNPSSKRTTIVAHQEPAIPRLSYDPNDVALAIARLQKPQQQQQHHSPSSFQGYDFGIWGNHNLNTNLNKNQNFLFGDSLGIGDSYHQNLFYGQMGIGNGESGITPFEGYAITTGAGTAVKQEVCKEGTDGSRVLWGFPFVGDGGADLGIGGWHGVVNSPLM